MIHDLGKWGLFLLGLGFFITFVYSIGCSIEAELFGPSRAENANTICQERGFDQYKDFKPVSWSYDVKAVKCENVGK